MAQHGKLTISAGVLALILCVYPCSVIRALPLSETLYIIPESEIELFLRGEIHRVSSDYRVEHPGVGLGILPDLTVWFHFMYLHNDPPGTGGEYGDSFINLLYHAADFHGNRIHAGLSVRLRLPTGKNAFSSEEWRNLSVGRNELRLGPVMRFDLPGRFYLHSNLFYTLRQGEDEDFYGGFSLNPARSETYLSVFGLNPFEDDTFLSTDRLKNDFLSLSLSINTDLLYPVIPYAEIYASQRLYRGRVECSSIQIEGCGIDPFLVSAGARYFFSRALYSGAYFIYNPIGENGYVRWISGVEVSLQF